MEPRNITAQPGTRAARSVMPARDATLRDRW